MGEISFSSLSDSVAYSSDIRIAVFEMVFKCESRNARFGIALLSIIISMGVIVFVDRLPSQLKQDQLIMNHICLLQIFASLILFVGSLKCKHWYFLPWLLIAVVFAYALVYKSIICLLTFSSDTKLFLEIICLLYIISGFWSYFIYAVFQDLLEMRSKDGSHGGIFSYNQNFEI